MKAHLMHLDRDFDLRQEPPRHERALMADLELETLLRAMSRGDHFLYEVGRSALLTGLQNDPATIRHRQEILKDSFRHPAVVRSLYDLAVEVIEQRRTHGFGYFRRYPGGILHESIGLLEIFLMRLRNLRGIADAQAPGFDSPGFVALFELLQRELTDDYFGTLENHLRELKFDRGVLMSAELGKGNEGRNYVLRLSREQKPHWIRLLFRRGPPPFTYHVPDRDEAGARALSELRDRGINLVANALAQSTEHILSFFVMLRTELAFYVGCLNLHDALAPLGARVCIPRPEAAGSRAHRFAGLYDVCLALTMERGVVGNAVDAGGKSLVVITGANQGGKSTFLRSIGLAQLMMQSGMFVAAESFAAELCAGLFTHYSREEDATMKHGKLDEELARMSDIVDALAPNALLLFNESFASTNEREGSEIARQIVRALLEHRIKVFFVTHLYDFAHGLAEEKAADALFLRAERRPDGTRTFGLIEGDPLETSYGLDVYREVFGEATLATER